MFWDWSGTEHSEYVLGEIILRIKMSEQPFCNPNQHSLGPVLRNTERWHKDLLAIATQLANLSVPADILEELAASLKRRIDNSVFPNPPAGITLSLSRSNPSAKCFIVEA